MINESQNKDSNLKTSPTKRPYRKPGVYFIGALEQVQNQSQGTHMDARSTTYLYFE